jgi:glutathione S-transferase
MKIYDFKGPPNSARVRIALAEKGLTEKVAFITIDVLGGEHKQPAFLAKNPSGPYRYWNWTTYDYRRAHCNH